MVVDLTDSLGGRDLPFSVGDEADAVRRAERAIACCVVVKPISGGGMGIVYSAAGQIANGDGSAFIVISAHLSHSDKMASAASEYHAPWKPTKANAFLRVAKAQDAHRHDDQAVTGYVEATRTYEVVTSAVVRVSDHPPESDEATEKARALRWAVACCAGSRAKRLMHPYSNFGTKEPDRGDTYDGNEYATEFRFWSLQMT